MGQYCGRGKNCNEQGEPRYGNHATFEEAKHACNTDKSCQMVMDRHCDERGPFQLCKSSSLCISGEGTCSYQKSLSK